MNAKPTSFTPKAARSQRDGNSNTFLPEHISLPVLDEQSKQTFAPAEFSKAASYSWWTGLTDEKEKADHELEEQYAGSNHHWHNNYLRKLLQDSIAENLRKLQEWEQHEIAKLPFLRAFAGQGAPAKDPQMVRTNMLSALHLQVNFANDQLKKFAAHWNTNQTAPPQQRLAIAEQSF